MAEFEGALIKDRQLAGIRRYQERLATERRKPGRTPKVDPAQEMHVLKNLAAPGGSLWYPAACTGSLGTPEWTFPEGALRRWP